MSKQYCAKHVFHYSPNHIINVVCPWCEIDRLKLELEEAKKEAVAWANEGVSLERQLAEARAENERLKSDLKYVGEHCANPEEQSVIIADARQEAAMECIEAIESEHGILGLAFTLRQRFKLEG